MLDYLDDVGHALKPATPEKLGELYASLGLQLTSQPGNRLVDVAIQPRTGSERVRDRPSEVRRLRPPPGRECWGSIATGSSVS